MTGLLFDILPPTAPNIPGLQYLPDFITAEEERALVKIINQQPWLNDLKRRVQHYGCKYDYKARAVEPPPINESGPRVNLDILWTHLRRIKNGSEEIYDGADYWVFAAGRGYDRAWMHD